MSYSGGSTLERECFGLDSVDKHGANYAISLSGGIVYHDGSRTTFRSYKDGVRIGCTFVSSAALAHIAHAHKDFLNNPTSKDHQ